MAQLQIFFAYYFFTFDWFRSSRLVSIEGDRRLEESSAQHANVYLRSMGCVEDVYRVCLRILWDVYVWSIGVRYIYLISMFYNAVDTVIYI